MLTLKSFELVNMHSFRHVARKSTWSCINSSTVLFASPSAGALPAGGARRDDIMKAASCFWLPGRGCPVLSSWSSLTFSRDMKAAQFGSMTSLVQKYSNCCTKHSILLRKHHALRFHSSSRRSRAASAPVRLRAARFVQTAFFACSVHELVSRVSRCRKLSR